MRKPFFIGTLLLTCLLVACSYTQPPEPENEVISLTVIDNVLYHQIQYVGGGRTSRILHSADGGMTWEVTEEFPDIISQELAASPSFPIRECVSETSHVCYRITGEAMIEKTTDGGKSWFVVWAFPSGRHSFVQRFYDTLKKRCRLHFEERFFDRFSQSCVNYPPTIIPQDLVITQGEEWGYVVTVAMGNEGILVQDHQGVWSRHKVYHAEPTPYRMGGMSESVRATLWESIFLTLVILLVNPFYSRAFTEHTHYPRLKVLFKNLALCGGGLFLCLIGTLLMVPPLASLPLTPLVSLLENSGTLPAEHLSLLLLLLALALLLRQRLNPWIAWHPLVDVIAMLAAHAPFPLWALGIIPWYFAAWVLSVMVAGVLVWLVLAMQ